MDQFNFKKFEGRNARQEQRITVTKKSYSIGFPTKFYADNNIEKYKYVVLFFDSEKKAIGIHFTNDENEKNKFIIHHSKDGYGGSIAVRSFMRMSGIEPLKYFGRYEWKKGEVQGAGDVFIIQLVEKVKKE